MPRWVSHPQRLNNRNPVKSARKGFAVVLALFALILLGALCTAIAFASWEDTRASAGELASARALAAAESAVESSIAAQDWTAAMLLRSGQHLTIHVTDPAPTAVSIARLDTTLFFIQGVTPDPIAGSANERFIRRVALTIELGADSAGILRALRVPNRGWLELF